MHHTVTCTQTLDAEPADVWAAWIDMESYPTWDPREEELRLDGPFGEGATGWSKQVGPRPGTRFTITDVDPGRGFTTTCPLPGGALEIRHRIEGGTPTGVRVEKTYTARGPMTLAFRLVFARGIRASTPGTFAALEAEARSRSLR
ncbi:SRPBCC family protein [Ammonicoccus fulvus]|uniref:SRPBCC family protein n=1 Tax=Ammonicoccus fulvus TaxID=3138240 RepID=A0ABZ3FK14_9ACTN